MWFNNLTGFNESSPTQVREQLYVDGDLLKSRVNGGCYKFGKLDTPSLSELRAGCANGMSKGKTTIREVVANVQDLHLDKSNANALFQVASQFNLLEMIGPSVTPERGVDIYETDRTQGPACAIACGAGTIYRNYFAEVNGEIGQTENNQIDCLRDIGEYFGNVNESLWQMRNGYALASADGLQKISEQIEKLNESSRQELLGRHRIGAMWDTQVTLSDAQHCVSQVYCSALPVAYSRESSAAWLPFAKLILDAAYEATLAAAVVNFERTGDNRVYLTLLGGGAFGNDNDWIVAAIARALAVYADAGLDVVVVSYGAPLDCLHDLPLL
ncbi:MAG: hypothetical protein H8E25_12925 [Planctomycetes bacterium]|nr:hypothetical protein [Planctomycetota bacterium]